MLLNITDGNVLTIQHIYPFEYIHSRSIFHLPVLAPIFDNYSLLSINGRCQKKFIKKKYFFQLTARELFLELYYKMPALCHLFKN